LVGSIAWSLTMVKSGIAKYASGVGFWGANGHDGIWHIALSESLAKGSLANPVFSGFNIQNYHIGFDLIVAVVHKISFIPVINLYFQILPPLFAAVIGILTYIFVLNWTKSKKSAFWSTFFVYFGGSLAYLIGKGESAFWSQQAISTLINPPFALSLIFILLGLIALEKNKKLLAILAFGLLIQIKVYAGLLVLGGLLVAGYYQIFAGALGLSLLIFLPFNKLSGGLIVFQPFWFLETMMGLSDRIGWVRFSEAMVNYKFGHVWLKGILAYGASFAVFILGNFGTRLIFLKDILKKRDPINFFFLSIILAGVVIPTFFLQKGTPWNTIQFIYYSLFFSGILAGIAMEKFGKLGLTLIVLATIPTTILSLKDVYIPSRPPAMLSNQEFEALNFLKKQPDGIVLTYPFDPVKSKDAEINPPRPLYLYASTAYVSAFSAHPTFLEDEINLDIMNYEWKDRRTEILNWYKEPDQIKVREFLSRNNIKYIYWLKGQRALLGETQLGLARIFENKEVDIYVVKSKQ